MKYLLRYIDRKFLEILLLAKEVIRLYNVWIKKVFTTLEWSVNGYGDGGGGTSKAADWELGAEGGCKGA